MNPVEIFVRHDAELDAFDYFQYLHERNPDAALLFLLAIDQTIKGLALQPLKGRKRRFYGRDLTHIRSWRVDDYENYPIFYRFAGSQLEILRIRHGAIKFPLALRRD